jgi:hypothetical protein
LDGRVFAQRATIYADAAEPARIQEISRKKINIKPAKNEVNKGIDFIKSIPLSLQRMILIQ